MKERNKLTVKIADKEYTIIADESREYMHKVADYVDKKMDIVRKQDNRLSTAMIAVLTSINTADEYFKLKSKEKELTKTITDYAAQIDKLNKEIDTLKRSNTISK